MSTTCLNCKKDNKTMIELMCEHQLCLQCAQKLKVAEGVGPLDAKFKICCPACRKNTITLNIQNLVNKDNQKLLFVNMQSSELSQQELQQGRVSESRLRKMSYTQRRSSVYAERQTPDLHDRDRKSRGHDSRGSNSRSRAPEMQQVKCSVHKEPLMFYCEQEAIVMCMQCMYKHMKQQKNHNVCSLTDALPTISRLNLQYKVDAKHRMEELDKNIVICKGNKNRIEQAYEIHQQLIGQEFRELEKLIKKKEQENRQHLERVFKRRQQEIGEQIKELNYLRSCLKEHFDFSIDNSNSNIYFFNAFSLLKQAVSKYTTTYKQIKKQQFFCFDKYASLDDFASLLDKFYIPREGGRESKANTTTRKDISNGPSRASEKGQTLKIKQQFYEQAKKKLERLNKMEQDHNVKKKSSKQQYLNNFFIDEVGKELDHNYSRLPGSAIPSYRKSSASEYVQRKVGQKTLTPTRMTPTPNHKTKKK